MAHEGCYRGPYLSPIYRLHVRRVRSARTACSACAGSNPQAPATAEKPVPIGSFRVDFWALTAGRFPSILSLMNRSLAELAAAKSGVLSGFRPTAKTLSDGSIDSAAYKAESREYIGQMVSEGRGTELADELAGTFGIKPGERTRLVMISGYKVG